MNVQFTVPGIPPTVNSYVRHTRAGRHYKTPEARRFRESVALLGKKYAGILGKGPYFVWIYVFLGKGDRLDIDNGNKVILDGMVDGGVLKSDANVNMLLVFKGRDRQNPRTEIWAGNLSILTRC